MLLAAVIVAPWAQEASQKETHQPPPVQNVGPAQLMGMVRSTDDHPVPDAKIEVIALVKKQDVQTGSDGRYEVRGLEPGTYLLNVNAPGFEPRKQIEVTVVEGAVALLDVLMRPPKLDDPYRIIPIPATTPVEEIEEILNRKAQDSLELEDSFVVDKQILLVFQSGKRETE